MNDHSENSQSFDAQDASAHYGAANRGHSYGYTQPAPDLGGRGARRRGMGPGAVIALCLVCSLLAAVLGAGGAWYFLRGETGQEAQTTPPPATAQPVSADAGAVSARSDGADAVGERIYELAKKQVVGITTEITYANFFGQLSSASVSGSGFIISDDGYIMTNNHVIEDARKGGYDVSVLTYDGAEYAAAIVGYDEVNDIAVLKIEAEGLSPAQLGDSGDIVVGREVYPVGNPLGELYFSMTTGIISATDRTLTTDTDSAPINMFQIDAAVNHGNSGGPVYNSDGRVIGVVTAKSGSDTEGLGFAIPIEDAAHVAQQIMQYGYVKDRATIGVTGITVTDSMAERYGMVTGAYMRTVTAGGPADQAGLLERDIVTAVDDTPVAGYTELVSIIRSYAVGDTAQFTVWRNGQTKTLTVTFGESQPPVDEPAAQQEQSQQYPYYMDDFFRQFFNGFGF